jgi:predicted unusual protein kinase regulating ubiquinone biosynthesis (AarF/ABC1/UbiB family)
MSSHTAQSRNPIFVAPTFRQRLEQMWRHWQRYSHVGWFLLRVFGHLLWWDGLLTLPILRWLGRAPKERWVRLAHQYCRLAMQQGGLLVKVGQFLSLRIDLLPMTVTQELAALQDRLSPAPFAMIAQALESDLGSPLADLFRYFAPEPVASASVAQVHLAQLHSGEQVVVKILRPGTPEQFSMDLLAFRWLVAACNLLPWVRRSFDLVQLLAEFTLVTRNELDFRNEGQNCEHFAQAFQNSAEVHIPKIYWSHSGVHTLTMENVAYLKLSDIAAIEATGINVNQVAERLAQLILRQIFVIHFVHADPHPGNIFIKPLPHPLEGRAQFLPGETVPYRPGRAFQIVFIDFGMAVEIPPQERAWLRDFIIGLGLRDPAQIVQSYVKGGLLRPGIDLERVEVFTADLLDGFQDMLVGLMPDPHDAKTRNFMQKHSDMMGSGYPFQIPMNLLFMYRALGTVGGVVKRLDGTFDLSRAAAPFATQLVVEEWQQDLQGRLQALGALGQLLVTTPMRLDQVFLQAQKAFQIPEMLQQQLRRPLRDLKIKTELTPTDRAAFQQLAGSVQRLQRAMTVMGVLVVVMLWLVSQHGFDIPNFIRQQTEQVSGQAVILSFMIFLWNMLRKRP